MEWNGMRGIEKDGCKIWCSKRFWAGFSGMVQNGWDSMEAMQDLWCSMGLPCGMVQGPEPYRSVAQTSNSPARHGLVVLWLCTNLQHGMVG
eukprot:1159417-Pelagomonas_calceolata.AAC.2